MSTVSLSLLLKDLRSRLSGILPKGLPSGLFLALGGVFLLAAPVYPAYVALNTWFLEQDRFAIGDGIAAFANPHDLLNTLSRTGTLSGTQAIEPATADQPVADPEPLPPVQIQIPAINIKRSIVELSRVQDPDTGTWGWDVEQLLEAGRKDLVGHWGNSTYPGQPGNMILAGHNYGYGHDGVFVRLDRLKAGDEVRVVNEGGETFTYRVRIVMQVPWRTQDSTELKQHGQFLARSGPERLTIVTCAGASYAPFPDRTYVVAEPVP